MKKSFSPLVFSASLGSKLFVASLIFPLSALAAEVMAQADRAKQEGGAERIELAPMTVTGQALERGYIAPNASTATKTDTPLMETPISIQVVPEAVAEDQQAIRLDGITQNVSGVQTMRQLGILFDNFIIRGFTSSNFNVYRDGLRLGTQSFETANLERVEILKGPPSALFGRSNPGGLVNMVTKKPLTQPYYALSQQFGSYDLYRTTLDATGAITDDGALAYRLNFVYLDSNSFRDFVDRERVFMAPQFTWKPTEALEVNFGYEYKNDDVTGDRGIPAIGNRPAKVSISRFIGEPDFSLQEAESHLAHLNWAYRFNENWKIQQRFAANILDTFNRNIVPLSLQADNRTINRGLFGGLTKRETYATDIHVNGQFDLFGARHNILVGFDYLRFTQSRGATFLASAPFLSPIDVFEPVYGTTQIPDLDTLPKNNFTDLKTEWFGVYFQDQMDLTEQLHLLFSGRYDWAKTESGFSTTSAPEVSTLWTDKFSPRVGLVYQPLAWLSLYANWTQALGANNGRSADGSPFKPEWAEQFEGGFKMAFFQERLNASVAVYELTKENVLTADISTPDPSDQVAIGEARSQGVEVDFSGQITEQWDLIGNYAYTATEVLKDNNGNQGNRLPNVPKHSGSVWTTYELLESFISKFINIETFVLYSFILL
ncbi:TonB-dependent siderophore receptor subfamily [Nitrosococcus oceani AFC27]|uniref:TonB-dependent siderophore receptor n=1 Tax=Nitrosococcus oceani TaxID=1229 RepID=UPI000183C9F9|nr:TonB-dependent siderophore receptor [Nitrosococcus oceani]EDZ66319.1 TonB-dependent siderophore receptor subfamily [Nitrosococcus oceani AFC27]GEM20607.1 TonB-dependent siderophore receptor [Nitrosococcus oceani]